MGVDWISPACRLSSLLRKPQSMSAVAVLSLYRATLRSAKQFPQYNFRCYAVRRTQQGFRENRALTDPAAIAAALERGQRDLALLRRQATVSSLFQHQKLVIEQ